jgi:hypothetical protein
MGYFISAQGAYYEGDRLSSSDLSVPQRPTSDYTWNGAQWLAPDPVALQDTRAQRYIDGLDRLWFEVNFDQENRVRALEGKAAITRAQYRDALINRWKALQS